MLFSDAYKGNTVLVTGHTGFKGSWLCEWLLLLGARVVGYALDPPTRPALFHQLGLEKRIAADLRGDVRDLDRLREAIRTERPAFVFHLAAQPIVRRSYAEPLETVETNALGTLHVLEALRREQIPAVAVMITTDKCYENREWVYGYREEDALGGVDPYSASKACAEILISSYRRAFFSGGRDAAFPPRVSVASVRAGNVIGGGDWAEDRIVPDCARALAAGRPIPVRNRRSTRSWFHVLEPLGGYLLLAAEMGRRRRDGEERRRERLAELCSAFNFGPHASSQRTVLALVQEVLRHWPGEWEDRSDPGAPHEAEKLNLGIDKACHLLGWRPQWDFPRTVEETVRWYRQAYTSNDAEGLRRLTRSQIRAYAKSLSASLSSSPAGGAGAGPREG